MKIAVALSHTGKRGRLEIQTSPQHQNAAVYYFDADGARKTLTLAGIEKLREVRDAFDRALMHLANADVED